jgi:hypothetical protein
MSLSPQIPVTAFALFVRLGVPIVLAGALSTAAQPARTLDLAAVSPGDGVLQRVFGSTGSGSFGVPVAGGHDCDGDGHRDTAIAFLTASTAGPFRSGEVDLVFGDGTLDGSLDTAVDDSRILRILGEGERETAGSEIWMDDVTGDGLGDLLVCRQNYSLLAGRIGAGALTVVVGGPALRAHAATLQPLDLGAPPAGIQLATLVGAQALDRFCIWARTGDVTGDGVADIVVGADQEDAPNENHRGAVWIVRGGPHLATAGVVDLASFGATVLQGHLAKITPPAGSNEFHLGATCQIADLNGNGRAEVLAAATIARAGAGIDPAGAPGSADSSGGAPGGAVYIAWDDNFPAGLWPPGFAFDISQSPGTRTVLHGEAANSRFGEEIVAGLDFDADGAADLFVGDLVADGSPKANRPASGLGHVVYGAAALAGLDVALETPPPGLRLTRILGPSNGALGADTVAQGDFDGDGTGDLAFASPHASPQGRFRAGVVHLLFGRPGGWPALVDTAALSLPPTAEVWVTEVQGARGETAGDAGDTLAYSAAAGDLDADGRSDLIVNEMVGNGTTPAAIDVGNLLLIRGAALEGPGIFRDGFESGNTGAWSLIEP